MKRITLLILVAVALIGRVGAQTNCYWVMLTDKQGTTFDPYTYFDAKAIERYQQCGADLYDISNYPVAAAYEAQVAALATDNLGPSRWLNAVAVMATPAQAAAIGELACVREVVFIGGGWQMAQVASESVEQTAAMPAIDSAFLSDQLVRMQGQKFKDKGFDGTGIRVAVFDGGFPHVNTHEAFRHLRDNNRIIKTWNFPDKKEDVYLAGSHGTMTLSCITGVLGGKQIGLATGAEFLLARTEIEPEPFKEEVWWMQAMEWADKNGANIISSSLGYGKDRHYTYEMDGRSYVAKAANMAARKGMLVCNSAGNEGDDKRWKTIITPADADSVLCIAGIEASLTSYRHIDFSSYGPGADGRRKPNVAAFGYADVAKHSKDNELTNAYGTSFSCPLVSGFAACAWQSNRSLTAMQLMEAIEKSADLYPYYDYALGYGVPQASYFTDGPVNAEPTFRFEDRDFYVAVVPTSTYKVPTESVRLADDSLAILPSRVALKPTFFFKAENSKGELEKYYNVEFDEMSPNTMIVFLKSALYKRTLVVHYNGYTESFRLSDQENRRLLEQGKTGAFEYAVVDTNLYILGNYDETMGRTPQDNRVEEKPWKANFLYHYGICPTNLKPYCDEHQFAVLFSKPLAKKYALGIGWDFDWAIYRTTLTEPANAEKGGLVEFEMGPQVFQRVTLMPGGSLFHRGLHWDLGLFAHWVADYELNYRLPATSLDEGTDVTVHKPLNFEGNRLHRIPFTFGATTRLSWDCVGLYATYRLDNLILSDTDHHLPALRAGIVFTF